MACLRFLGFLMLAAALGCVPSERAGWPDAGPLQLHPDNPHYLVYRGQPIVLVTAGEHYGAVVNPDFQFRRYLATLAADNLNYTRIFTGAYVEPQGAFGIERNTLAPDGTRFLAPWARSEEAGYVGGGNRFDLDRWDEAYFNRLHDFVTAASELGIVVEVTLFSSYYGNFGFSPLHPDNNVNLVTPVDPKQVQTLENGELMVYQEGLVRKLVQELNAFENVFWEVQNEPYADRPLTVQPINPFLPDWREEWRNRVDLADDASLDWQRRIVEIIRDEESRLPRRHLIAQNYGNFRYPLSGVHDEISIVNFHYAYPEAVTWNRGLNRVTGFDESGFSGSGDEPYRRQAWSFILAGGGLFNHLDYSFFPGAEDGTGVNRAPGGGSPVLRRQLGVLSRFIHSFDFAAMAPDHSSVHSAPGATVQCLSRPGEEYALYLQGTGPVDLRLDIPKSRYRVKWISPESGEVLAAEEFGHRGGERVLRSPPFEVDVALEIRSR